MQNHDAFVALSGQLAYKSVEEIEEAAKEIAFGGEIYIEEVCVRGFEGGTDVTLEGKTVEYPAHVMVFFNIDAFNGVDYADEGNADGLRIDLEHKLKANFPAAFIGHVQWRSAVSRPQFCSHPSIYHDDSSDGVTGCKKCGGPIIA